MEEKWVDIKGFEGKYIKYGGKQMENKKLRELLLNLGIYSNLQGYQFILESYDILSKQKMHTKMSTIYEMLGKKFEKNPSAIERGIRTTIEKSFKHGRLNEIYNKNPKNSVFLYDLCFNFDILENKILEETNEESKTKNKGNASNTVD